MFSLQPSDELVFGAPTAPAPAPIPSEDLIMKDEALTQTNFINFGSESRRVMNSGLTHQREGNSNSNIRRDIERKRRLEMSNLHLTLTSLLPTKLNKGKTGVCDQMQEASNYIKSMQNKIEELRIRRDELNKLLSENKVVTTIDVLPDGMMEILVKTSHVCFGISRVFQVLAETELDVVNCVSTRTNPGFLHKFHIQANDIRSLDLSVLQDKLCNAMK